MVFLWVVDVAKWKILYIVKSRQKFSQTFAISTKDHDENTCLTGTISAQVSMCRKQFNGGNFRFESQECKNIGMDFWELGLDIAATAGYNKTIEGELTA